MIRILFALALVCLGAAPAAALDPERREVVVVSMRAWDGYQYKETFLPSNLPELTLITGQDSALAFVRTQEYFWPLSRQVYVDFEKQRDVLEGALRIEQDGKLVAEEPLQPYAILYPEGAINGNGSLLWGDDAVQGFVQDQQSQRDFERQYQEAQRANAEYERKLLESGAARVQGKPAEVIPPPPPLPKPSLRLVTKPLPGFRVNLPPGAYSLSVWKDGALVPGTRRSLRVVSVEGRNEVVADIIPEERWTHPLASNSDRSRIFVRPGATFYVALAEASRFDEADYLPVISPQAQVVAGREIWIRRKPSTQAGLASDAGTVPLTALKVDQTEGSGFGYVVRAAKPGETPDLTAFAITVPADGVHFRAALDASPAAFQREVVVVQPRNSGLALGLALLPLLAGLGLLLRRRRLLRQT